MGGIHEAIRIAAQEVLSQLSTQRGRPAVCCQQLEEIADHNAELAQPVQVVNLVLVQAQRISTITIPQLLSTAGDNPERVTSEAAFAMLCGAAPIPAASGPTI